MRKVTKKTLVSPAVTRTETVTVKKAVYKEAEVIQASGGIYYRFMGKKIPTVVQYGLSWNGNPVERDRVTVAQLKALYTGEYEGVPGFTPYYSRDRILAKDYELDNVIFKKGSKYEIDYAGSGKIRVKNSYLYLRVPKDFLEPKVAGGYQFRGHMIKRQKASVKIGCRSVTYKDLKELIKYADKHFENK